MTQAERSKILRVSLAERKEYEEFLEWVDEHNPDAWMTFEEWRAEKFAIAAENAQSVWHENEPEDVA